MHSPLIIVLIVALLAVSPITAQQQTSGFVRPGDPSIQAEVQELQEIRFEGLEQTTPEQLLGIISARASELSISHQLTRYFRANVRQNPSSPTILINHLDSIARTMESEVRYYEVRTAEGDSAALLTYLNQNGFHKARVRHGFGRDGKTGRNTLVFRVSEGPRAVIDTVIYLGLSDLPSDVADRVDSRRQLRSGEPFSENAIDGEVRLVYEELRNSGYFRAWADRPYVGRSADLMHDTVVIVVDPGTRCKISALIFEENSGGYPSITEGTRRRQLEMEEGQWFSADRVSRSRNNLITLGAFESVTIDTVPADQCPMGVQPNTDSTIALRVFTRNAKYYDVGTDLLLYQTSIDNYLNFGVGALALHRNAFGGAQQLSLQGQFVLQDISRAFQGQQLETETIAQIGFDWPSAFRVLDQRARLIANTQYSLRRLVETFQLESSTMTLRMPISLYQHTLFNGLEFSTSFERQIPRDYQGALDSALVRAETPAEIENILQTFLSFVALENHLQTGAFLTGAFVGFSLRGEHRDNPVNPTNGIFTSVSAEYGDGAGRFVRAQFFNGTYTSLRPRLVAATKVRLGHIMLIDPLNTYVPLERQFFAGGAASIRSYPSRQLHDVTSGSLNFEGDEARIFNNILGSASLIELGFELRYSFKRPSTWPDLLATFVESSGITLFTDVGNAFNRLTVDKYNTARLYDFLAGSVVAAGIGYRFQTPVGPFRVDYATSIYDPALGSEAVIWNGRRNIFAFSNWQLSIGLGHAF
jgi:outer membrane protein assembly factor BamA